jgi:hypothetical protein
LYNESVDEHLQQLKREAYSSGNPALLQRLYQKLLHTGAELESFVTLRDYIASLIPEDVAGDDDVSDDIAQEPIIELTREISRYLVRNNYDYYAGTPVEKVDYDNPPPEASTWAFIELDETEYWTDSAQKKVAGLTGVYLVDTGTNWHLCSAEKSVWLEPMYANVLDVIRQSSRDDDLRDAWYVDNNGHYIARRDLRHTFGWQWIPQSEINEIIEDLDLDMADQESQRALQDGILEYYAGSPPF